MGETPYDAYYPDEPQKALDVANRYIAVLEEKLARIESAEDDEAVFGDHNLIPSYKAEIEQLKATNKSLREQLPGTVAAHAVITDTCRENRNDNGAIIEAIGRIENAFYTCVQGWPKGSGAQFHVILRVERPNG